MRNTAWALLTFISLSIGSAQEPESPIERYRRLEFLPKDGNFDKGWKDRVLAEYDVINAADVQPLRAALKDADPLVRAVAARALGIRGDKDSAEVLAEMVKSDPDYAVRIRAVESLGYLKMKAEIIELATKDKSLGVQWSARMAAAQLKSEADLAAAVRQAYAAGIKREVIASAKVGRPALDFAARTSDGQPFKLTSVLGKKPIAIYFAAFDG